MQSDVAIVVPMANESASFDSFISHLKSAMDKLISSSVYLVTDNASKDNTAALCIELCGKDSRFIHIHEPANRNVGDAYRKGMIAACEKEHKYIIELDAGMSHDPAMLLQFHKKLEEGFTCVLGSRTMKGGDFDKTPFTRRFLSFTGNVLSNFLLGTRYTDSTSGYQGFHLFIARELIKIPLRSTGHFYQTEIRFHIRNCKWCEIPITYRNATPGVKSASITNALRTLLYYSMHRVIGRSKGICN